MIWLLAPLAAIGAYSVARWVYKHRNDGSALPGVLRPWGRLFP